MRQHFSNIDIFKKCAATFKVELYVKQRRLYIYPNPGVPATGQSGRVFGEPAGGRQFAGQPGRRRTDEFDQREWRE